MIGYFSALAGLLVNCSFFTSL